MIHGAGIFTYISEIIRVNVGTYTSTMEHLGIYIYIIYINPIFPHNHLKTSQGMGIVRIRGTSEKTHL